MAEVFYGHFDSTPEDPRPLLAADWARYIGSFITNGIRNGGTCLEVTANTGMTVKVDNGIVNILGYVMEVKTDLNGRYYTVVVPPAHPQYPRIDRLVYRLDRRIQTRNVKPVVLMGTAAATPVPPPLTRTADVWELSGAQIRVNANTVAITAANIKEERFDTDACGLMNSVLGLDPSVWQDQFDSFMAGLQLQSSGMLQDFQVDLAGKLATFQSQFDAFFTDIRLNPQRYISFNFENIIDMKGTTYSYPKKVGNVTTETIVNTGNNKLVATRIETKTATGTTTVQILYDVDGVTVLRENTLVWDKTLRKMVVV